MRINYEDKYPTDYIMELKRAGNRKKAMAFMDYYSDMEFSKKYGDGANSFGFYAKAWSVSKSTAHKWVDEFKYEIDLFINGWWLRNQQHYNNVKKATERLPNGKHPNEAPTAGVLKNGGERLPNEVFNIYNDDMRKDLFFIDLFAVYARSTKFPGKKNEAYIEYLKIKDEVSYKELKRAIILYLHDMSVSKKYNFTNFLKNNTYLSYIPKVIKILIDGTWEIGEYDDESERFKYNNTEAILTSHRLGELYKAGKLEFLGSSNAVCS